MAADMFRLDGKTVVVVGGGGGIGEACAVAIGAQGAHTVCLDLKGDAAAATAERIVSAGGSADHGTLDLVDGEATTAALEQVARKHGRIDGLVCTPAVNVRKPILEYSLEEFDRVVALNLRGNFAALMAAGRIMTGQKSGSIVLFSSIRSIVTEPGQSVYSMTKAGILQLAKTAATEWAPHGVRVNAIGPGVIETPLTAPIKNNPDWYKAYAMKNPMNRWGQPSEMAGPAVFLLSDAASYITGTIIYADGGWLAADGRFTPPGM
ncbi:MAG TPA: SDR family oxidoreductase [Vicinamibacterales bacterium]|nr:SDR family oxidoreductase [Vicinamibacterales bacterium]